MKTGIYRYYTLYRPPMPGAIPREGLVNVYSCDYKQRIGGVYAWGYAEYNRPLSDEEISEYELSGDKMRTKNQLRPKID